MPLTQIFLAYFACTLLRSASVHGDILSQNVIVFGPRQKATITDEQGLLKLTCVCQAMLLGENLSRER